ncbi:potassium-transporting ATPase subunit B, partial [Ensifer sp. P24N7]
MTKHPRKDFSLLDRALAAQAARIAVAKLDPRVLYRNPVMFVTGVVALLTTFIFLRDVASGAATTGTVGQIAFWLWVTVLFANFAEAIAEGRGKARADSLRATQSETECKRLRGDPATHEDFELVSSRTLR